MTGAAFPSLRFKVLGSLELTIEDRVVTPRPKKLRSILGLLCVKAGSVVSPDYLIDAVWSGSPPRTARAALQVYVSHLRKCLDTHGRCANKLVSRPHGYLLELDDDELDLLAFDRLSERARVEAAAGRPDEALRCLREASSLWDGPALADLRRLSVFARLARQLDEKRIEVLERRIDLQLRMGQHKDLVGELYGLADEYPMWEVVHAQLMISLYRSGRIAESLEAYRNMRESLIGELGVEPGESIQHLHQSILMRDPALDEQPGFLREGDRPWHSPMCSWRSQSWRGAPAAKATTTVASRH